MQNLSLNAIVTKTGLGFIDINGFKYNTVEIDVANIKGFKAYVPIFVEVDVGDHIRSSDWIITRYDKTDSPTVLCVRFGSLEIVSEEDFTPNAYFRARVSGMYITSDKSTITTVGPSKKPFIRATLKLKDEEDGKPFSILLVGFNKVANQLSNTKKTSIISAEVCIRPKKYVDGYEFCVNEFNVIKEA